MQLQASHHIFGTLWLHVVCVDAVGGGVHWTGDCASVLRHIYGHRSCILHVHLCESRTQQIPNGHRAHEVGNFVWTIFGRRFRPMFRHHAVDELQAVELCIVWG